MIQLIGWAVIILAVACLFLILVISWGKAIHDEVPLAIPSRSPDTCPPDCPCRGTLADFGPEFWPTVYRQVMDEDRAQQIGEGVPAHLLYDPEGGNL